MVIESSSTLNPTQTPSAVYVEKLSFRYRSPEEIPQSKHQKSVLEAGISDLPLTIEDTSFSLPSGKLMLVTGPSSCGKSTLRFLPTTVRDFRTTLDAQRARGFEIDKLRGGIFAKVARMAPMLVSVVIGSIVGAQDIINAMELRCFGIGKRTWLVELHTRKIDRVLIAMGIAVFIAISILNILGYFFKTVHCMFYILREYRRSYYNRFPRTA